jgi:hypothetical protein
LAWEKPPEIFLLLHTQQNVPNILDNVLQNNLVDKACLLVYPDTEFQFSRGVNHERCGCTLGTDSEHTALAGYSLDRGIVAGFGDRPTANYRGDTA